MLHATFTVNAIGAMTTMSRAAGPAQREAPAACVHAMLHAHRSLPCWAGCSAAECGSCVHKARTTKAIIAALGCDAQLRAAALQGGQRLCNHHGQLARLVARQLGMLKGRGKGRCHCDTGMQWQQECCTASIKIMQCTDAEQLINQCTHAAKLPLTSRRRRSGAVAAQVQKAAQPGCHCAEPQSIISGP